MDLLTLDDTALGAMRPSSFKLGASTAESAAIDMIVQTALAEDFPIVRSQIPSSYFLDRLGSAIFYRIPWLMSLPYDLSRMNALELGCGRGLKALPWSRLFHSYVGVDLDPEAICLARSLAREARRTNLQFYACNATEVVRDPERFGLGGRVDVVILYAVIEHLIPSERRQIISFCRELLQEGGLLVVCETPNRLIPHDGHSTGLHFFQSLPPEIALQYGARAPRTDAVKAAASGEEALYRFGQGASYHEFELWLAGLDGKLPGIVTDGWSHWPIFDEPLRRDELWLLEYLDAHGPLAAPAFARYWIDAVFDFSRPPGETPGKLRVVRPRDLTNATIFTDRRFYQPDTLVCHAPGSATFSLAGLTAPTVLLDVERSTGEIALEDATGRVLALLSVDELRCSRFPRWHSGSAVDLTAFGPIGALTIRPAYAGSCAVCTGVIARSLDRNGGDLKHP